MADNHTRHQDRLFLRVAIFILLCCLSGFVLYYSVRWWTTWRIAKSNDPAVAYLRNQAFGRWPMEFRVTSDDGFYKECTLKEILAMSVERRSALTIRWPSGPLIKEGKKKFQTQSEDGQSSYALPGSFGTPIRQRKIVPRPADSRNEPNQQAPKDASP